MKKYLAIIPARGGSKSIKNKNFIDLNGKPLISYSIEESLKVKNMGYLDEVIVSTDSLKIKEISEMFGAKVPFLRPNEISNDNAKSIDLILHAIEFYKKKDKHFDAVILLQPTSPLRKSNDILNALKLFEEFNSESLISCFEEEYINESVMYKASNEHAIPLSKDHNIGGRRQEKENVYIRNGAIYITKTSYLILNKKIISDKPLMYLMKKDKSINIDSNFDLELARWTIMR